MKLSIRAVAVCAAALSVCMIAVSGATARIVPTLTTTLTTGDTFITAATGVAGINSSHETPVNQLGAHPDFNVDMTFRYGGTLTGGNGGESVPTYPAGSDNRETVQDLVVDIPPGLVGNPNAIPYEERCDISTFETGECPDSSTVGEIWLKYSLLTGDFTAPTGALWIKSIGPKTRSDFSPGTPDPSAPTSDNSNGWTRVSLIKSDPEVPAKIGIFVNGPFNFDHARTMLSISPRTDSDLRLRTLTVGGIPHTIAGGPDPGDTVYNFRMERMKMKLYGTLPNGHNFMTSPTSCEPWTSTLWAHARYVNDTADADPLATGTNTYSKAPESTITPDCSNAGAVPFPINGAVSIDTPERDYAPSFDFTITNPGVQGDGQVSTTPKKIVTTIPASINVDVQQLGRTCTLTDFNADACAKSARVGSVKIETPLIRAGLTGDVYLVKRNATSGLPDLGLRVRGAITFTQLGSNRYVGVKNNQIETTFDNIPQVGFTKLTFHLDGGPQGLLRSLSCPTYNKAPALPNFTYNFFAYTGAFKTVTTPMNLANCFGIQTLKKYPKCLTKKLPIHPNYQSRVRVKSVSVKIDGKKRATTKKAPFRFDLKIQKLKLKAKPKHKLELKATYDDGTVSKKTVNFKVCK